MQTVLGANGQIAVELTRELYRSHTHDIRLVSRHPQQVHDTDELVAADLTDAEATSRAVAGSEIAYLTVGLPLDTQLWEEQFPTMMRNVIDACVEHGTTLVYFDNTYMYPGSTAPLKAMRDWAVQQGLPTIDVAAAFATAPASPRLQEPGTDSPLTAEGQALWAATVHRALTAPAPGPSPTATPTPTAATRSATAQPSR